MTHSNQKGKTIEKNGLNPVVAVLTGAVVGAGVAVAGVALKDKKNRDKITEVFTDAKDQAIGYIEDIQKQVQDKKGVVDEKIAQGKERLDNVVNAAQGS